MKLIKDPFTEWLMENGRPPEVYQPAGFLGEPPIGWRLKVGNSSFVYRVPEETPDRLTIILFERLGDRNGLFSPFANITRFISLVKRSGAPIKYIQGRVEALSMRPKDSLENERIAAFYQRYLKAYQIFIRDGVEWFAGDLDTYEPPLKAEQCWLNTQDSTAPQA